MSLGLIFSAFFADPASAQLFKPQRNGAPATARGGGARGACPTDLAEAKPLIPVLPEAQASPTISDRPALFVYVPEASVQRAFFSLEDESGQSVYQSKFELPQDSGILKITLPKTAPALEIGKRYLWSLVMICGEELEPDSPMITGWMERQQPLDGSTSAPVSLNQAAILGQAGLWYDMIDVLAQLKQTQPDDSTILQVWRTELISAGLEEIVDQPFLDPGD
ncbi:MAG: DUF928 domain-containing protein [Microcoleaceae cyanobacterium]